MEELINNLIFSGYLKTPRIIEAFRKIDRADFVPPDLLAEAYGNYPLPIGYGQTISQPLTVAFMFELLQPERGDKILDVGSGSGWTTALLAYIVSQEGISNFSPYGGSPEGGQFLPLRVISRRETISKPQGKVIAMERILQLVEFGKNNVAKYNFIKKGVIEFICTNGSQGLKEKSPFDRILASAAVEQVPVALKEQLKVGGRLVIPVQNSIFLFVKTAENKFSQEEFPGFAFVPLIKDK
jgi:protein-L-isoaspartate(D-aspartate) O-methyltransferase